MEKKELKPGLYRIIIQEGVFIGHLDKNHLWYKYGDVMALKRDDVLEVKSIIEMENLEPQPQQAVGYSETQVKKIAEDFYYYQQENLSTDFDIWWKYSKQDYQINNFLKISEQEIREMYKNTSTFEGDSDTTIFITQRNLLEQLFNLKHE